MSKIQPTTKTIAVALPLAAILSLSSSHHALAACVGSVNPLTPAIKATVNTQTSVTVECGVATPNPSFPAAPVSPASDGDLTVAPGDVTTYKDTSTQGTVGTGFNAVTNPNTVNNNMIQFDGHGRTLTVGEGAEVSNERVINGTNGGRNRSAVLMGAATQNESASTTFASAPVAGVTTVTLNSVTPAASWVGQSMVFGRFDAGQSDFYPGQAFVITAVDPINKTVTLVGALPSGFEGDGPASFPLVFNVTSNYGSGKTIDGVFYNNVVDNAGIISTKITAAEVNANKSGATSPSTTAQAKGVTTSVAGDYLILNRATGVIKATNGAFGNTYAVEGGGAVTSLTVNNSGQLLSERTSKVTLQTATATANPTVTSTDLPGIAAVALGQANAINIQEEVETFNLTNNETGAIRAKGDYSAAIVTRAASDIIINRGLIEAHNAAGGSTKSYAIGANSDPGAIREMSLTNTGTINGDILAVNGSSLRWYLLSTEAALAPNGKDDRLTISSQHGQFNSETENSGSITGNLYYSNGEHDLANEGTIKGNIDVDQRPTTTGIASGALTVLTDEDGNATNNTLQGGQFIYRGAKSFTFENAGTYQGDITIATAKGGTVLGLDGTPDSTITLAPHVYGGGGDSADTATGPDTIATFEGTLKIADGMVNGTGGISSIARTTTLAPVIDGTVKDGEWFTVANKLFGTDLPNLDDGGSILVDWSVAKNAAGALVVGATVTDATTIEGVSLPAGQTINGLIAAGGEDPDLDILGAAVENITDAKVLAKAGAQLAPQTNYATQQASITLNQAFGQHIDQRLAGSGATGSGFNFGAPSGLGMKSSQEGRSNLGRHVHDEEAVYSPAPSNALWGEAFGAGLNQGDRALVDGYDARIYGAIAGYDNWINPGARLGVAVGYANTSIDDTGFTHGNTTDIDSYLVEAYGSVKGSGWYVTGRTGFTWHKYDTHRALDLLPDTADGSHDGHQFNAAIEFGAPMRVSGAIVTPVAGLTYSRLTQNGYTENGGPMALTIGDQSNDSAVTSLGLKALVPIAADTVLEGRAFWLHELGDNAQFVTAAFAAGGGTFTASGPDVGRDTAALGVGLKAAIAADTKFELNYDANLRQDFQAHIGSARVTIGF